MRQNQKSFLEPGRGDPNKKTRLVIEANTIYEIDEQCYQCLMKQRTSGPSVRQRTGFNYNRRAN